MIFISRMILLSCCASINFARNFYFKIMGVGGRTLFFRDSTPCRPTGSPLCTIFRSVLVFREKRAKKNAIFWSKFSKKCLKTSFLAFKKIACGAEKLVKLGSLQRLGRAQNINLADLKKFDKIFKIFLKIPPPPREIS